MQQLRELVMRLSTHASKTIKFLSSVSAIPCGLYFCSGDKNVNDDSFNMNGLKDAINALGVLEAMESLSRHTNLRDHGAHAV
ncbi:hypothetical protein ACHAW5_000863 [Stephanodiscus triporus]|uniref:Uncharacterized protein n=1 Tax=Stephanodiscus triporus TaxID=2934178 RepID=A0ABD3PTT7_9STRA